MGFCVFEQLFQWLSKGSPHWPGRPVACRLAQTLTTRAFLLWLLTALLAVLNCAVPPMEEGIVLVDATRLKEPGGIGDDWRVHIGYDLLIGRLLDVKVSDGYTADRPLFCKPIITLLSALPARCLVPVQ